MAVPLPNDAPGGERPEQSRLSRRRLLGARAAVVSGGLLSGLLARVGDDDQPRARAEPALARPLRVLNVGKLGPSLDFVRPPAWVVRRRIREGSHASWAVMPPDTVTGSDAADVVAFVARVAGR